LVHSGHLNFFLGVTYKISNRLQILNVRITYFNTVILIQSRDTVSKLDMQEKDFQFKTRI
jgi:hypothetical protein